VQGLVDTEELLYRDLDQPNLQRPNDLRRTPDWETGTVCLEVKAGQVVVGELTVVVAALVQETLAQHRYKNQARQYGTNDSRDAQILLLTMKVYLSSLHQSS